MEQLGSLRKLYYSDKVDFMDSKKRLFKVGGKEKKTSFPDF